jgi:hypothetical protein
MERTPPIRFFAILQIVPPDGRTTCGLIFLMREVLGATKYIIRKILLPILHKRLRVNQEHPALLRQSRNIQSGRHSTRKTVLLELLNKIQHIRVMRFSYPIHDVPDPLYLDQFHPARLQPYLLREGARGAEEKLIPGDTARPVAEGKV